MAVSNQISGTISCSGPGVASGSGSGNIRQGAIKSGDTGTVTGTITGTATFTGLPTDIAQITQVDLIFVFDAAGSPGSELTSQGNVKYISCYVTNTNSSNKLTDQTTRFGRNRTETFSYTNANDLTLFQNAISNGSLTLKTYRAGESNCSIHSGSYSWTPNYYRATSLKIQITYIPISEFYQLQYYNGTTWAGCTPYIYQNGTWVQVEPYRYNGTEWVRFY